MLGLGLFPGLLLGKMQASVKTYFELLRRPRPAACPEGSAGTERTDQPTGAIRVIRPGRPAMTRMLAAAPLSP